jgi:hypothetical protein
MEHKPRRRTVAAVALLAVAVAGSSVAGSAASPGSAGSPAPQAPMCGAYDELRTFLGDRFDERPTSSGLADDGTVLQVFASPAAETWTMVSVDVGGLACVLATGQAWQQEALAGLGAPA